MKERKEVSQAVKSDIFPWAFKLSRLTKLALQYIAQAPSNENIATLMRFVEVFTAINTFEDSRITIQIFDYLVRHDFYAHLRKICDNRIPPMVAETVKAPTPQAETYFNLITQPLRVSENNSASDDLARKSLISLTESFLSAPFSEQVDYFIVPSLASRKSFPYALWSKVLHQEEVKKTSWLLYSFLRIGKIHLGRDSSFDVLCYLNVLSDLTGTILNTSKIACMTSGEESDSDDEKDDKNDDVDMPDFETSTNQRSVTMLNDEEVVSSLVSATEKSHNEPMALTALCKLCHNLLLSDPLALHHFRLLYTLAFRPVLLHRLWNLILDTKRPSLVGSSIPLLTVISRGIRLSVQERNAIVPILAVFASLFCYLLVTIHDTEFYGDEVASGANPRIWMPFTLSELVPMSLSLRDVTLGLIELAFPQSRPAVREEYQLAVK